MVKIEIPDEIYASIEEVVKDSDEFKDVEDYVAFVLTEVLKDDEEEDEEEPLYSEEDEEKIKERLRGLGYL